MKKDTSRILHDSYYSHENRLIRVDLKNGRTLHGRIVGFYAADAGDDESPIHHWHFAPGSDVAIGRNLLGIAEGEIIRHSEIRAVTFEEDNTTLVL